MDKCVEVQNLIDYFIIYGKIRNLNILLNTIFLIGA
jgi:hypothetical protein